MAYRIELVTSSLTTSATSSKSPIRSHRSSVFRVNFRALPTASKWGGSEQEAEVEAADESIVGSPLHKGESTVDPSVPIRGTPGSRVRDVHVCELHGCQCARRMQGQMHVHAVDLGAHRGVGVQFSLRPLR
ncbi:hypothetical protein GCM10010214_60620 [Streptomyces abikoensis]|nr:hypothetical protein GCM10010214_60620 [Streptomyces abikoensis]